MRRMLCLTLVCFIVVMAHDKHHGENKEEVAGLQCVRGGGKCVKDSNFCGDALTKSDDCPPGTFCCSQDCDDQGACDGGHGVCRESCLRLERQVREGCGDSDCKCCTLRQAECSTCKDCPGVCVDTRVCTSPLRNYNCSRSDCVCCDKCYAQPICNGSNGVCREGCYSGELEVEGGCISPGCKCCTPRYTNCPVTNNCSGVCMDVKLCKNPLANNSCIGSDCICCDKCSINPVCDEGYGVCREFCLKEELEVKDGCGDSACKCCSSRLATCNASNSCSGICTDVRTCTNPLGNNCSGLNCVCCDKCNAQPFCDDGNGVCREACHSQESEIENGCSVSGCKCCTLQEATCNASAQCPGMCVDSRKCTKPLHNSRCSGRHCICCDKCNAQPFCDGGHGVCRSSCLSHEREDEGSSCGESGCKCCTVRLAVCLSSNNCSGICLDSSLCTNPIANSSCSGDYCVCCDKCNNQKLCDDGHGVCRAQCENKERDAGVCDNTTGCRCCTSRMATCANTADCPGVCMDKRMCSNRIRHHECSSSDCVCCDKCNAHPFCNDGHGVCRVSCNSKERVVNGSCGNTGCKCCSYREAKCPDSDNCPGICIDKRLCFTALSNFSCDGPDCTCCDKCNAKPFCDNGYGVCREFCHSMEREIHDDCGHTACKCCTTRLASCTTLNNTRVVCTNNCTFYQRSLGTCTENCTTYDDNVGTCVDYRMCTNPLEQQCCVEPGCVCCDRCSAQPFCDDGYGVCRERCGREERHLHRGCKESGCKCCTSRLATCRNVASCPGECRDRRLCFQPIANYTCDGPDCMCCDTCSEQSSCDNGYGRCRLSCLPSERVVSGCVNHGCVCCTSSLVTCNVSLADPAICIDTRLCSTTYQTRDNANCLSITGCTSCDSCPILQQTCTNGTNTGVCRAACSSTETASKDTTECADATCVCCY